MKQGKGIFLIGARCQECNQPIGPGTKEAPAYWAYDRNVSGDRYYYHRSCARKVTKRHEAAWARALADMRATQATQAVTAKPAKKAAKRGR